MHMCVCMSVKALRSFAKWPLYRDLARPLLYVERTYGLGEAPSIEGRHEAPPVSVGKKTKMCVFMCVYKDPKGFAKPLLYNGIIQRQGTS